MGMVVKAMGSAVIALVGVLMAAPVEAQMVKDFQKISDTRGGFTGVMNDAHYFGASVVSLGDLNGDGIGDVAVGANGDDENGWLHGAVWVLFLASDGTVADYQKINESNGGFTAVLSDAEHFGTSITNLGDLDGDGVVDMAVGGFGHQNVGAVWILFLQADGQVARYQEISQNTGGFTGSLMPNNRFGHGVASMGDIDGDGVVDLAVGTWADDDGGPDRGAVWILFLKPDGTVKRHQKISSTQGGFTGPLDDGDIFGVVTANIGDLDGDGRDELAVGAIYDDDGAVSTTANRGAVWILFLNADGTVRRHQKISDTQGGFTGVLDDEDFFAAPAGIGDLDRDGIPDMAVGASRDDDIAGNAGAVWLLFLRHDGTVRSHQKIAANEGALSSQILGGDTFGSSIANMGDFDGDGVQDLAVGAVFDKDGGWLHGALWLLWMHRPGVRSFTLIDAETDLPVPDFDPIPDHATLNIKRLPRYLNLRADVAGSYESVRFAFDGDANFRTENVAPYALFGDVDGDYALGAFRLGDHRLKATPYSQDNAQGIAGTPTELNFTVVREDPGMEVSALTLVDAATERDLFKLVDGMALNLAALPPSLNVRADVIGPVASVRFTLDAYVHTEENPPYALFGDVNGKYAGGSFASGEHVLTATPFRQAGAKGSHGDALTVHFTVGGPPPGLVLWNTLGSDEEVLNSAFGPDLSFYTGDAGDVVGDAGYVPGVFGDAVELIGSYSLTDRVHTIMLENAPAYLNTERGTIEVWYMQKTDPVSFERNSWRVFDGGFGLGSGVDFQSYDGDYDENTAFRFGLLFGAPRVAVQSLETGLDGYNISAYNGTWIHLAGVWDRDGIDGSDDAMRLYVNGDVVASTSTNTWGTVVGSRAEICGANDDSAERFAMDNLKVWNYARTDFSDRFVEGFAGYAGKMTDPDDAPATATTGVAAASDGAYPNPFNPTTTIHYTLAQTGRVRVAVYDLLGRQVRLLVDGVEADGSHEVTFDAGNLPSGTYVYRVETPTAIETYTILLLK